MRSTARKRPCSCRHTSEKISGAWMRRFPWNILDK